MRDIQDYFISILTFAFVFLFFLRFIFQFNMMKDKRGSIPSISFYFLFYFFPLLFFAVAIYTSKQLNDGGKEEKLLKVNSSQCCMCLSFVWDYGNGKNSLFPPCMSLSHSLLPYVHAFNSLRHQHFSKKRTRKFYKVWKFKM